MSTRSIITFKLGDEILQVYKHWDGYPETTVPELQKFLKWNGHRNDDLSYTMANFCYWFKTKTFEEQKVAMEERQMVDGKKDSFYEDFMKSQNTSAHTGLGILPKKVMNFKQASEEYMAEYFYTVDLEYKTIDEEVTETMWSFTNKKGKNISPFCECDKGKKTQKILVGSKYNI